ncbi:MAG: hypothetical protein AAB582_03450 [Patescibacteria group bacterium]
MVLFIPLVLVEEQGRRVPLPDSWTSAKALLREDQRLAAVHPCGHTENAVLVEETDSFSRFQEQGINVYVIEGELARRASPTTSWSG